jgi:Uma2 family endonuclease
MSLADPPVKRVTADEFCAIPEQGIDRELIRGEVREYGSILRDHWHSETLATVGYHLVLWHDANPQPHGVVVSGFAGFLVERDPDTLVGIDAAFASGPQVARLDPRADYFDFPPTLAVEVLSVTDRHGDVVEKVKLYLGVGTVVWIVDPHFQTVNVHREGREVEVVGVDRELNGEPYLPGFRLPVAAFFE